MTLNSEILKAKDFFYNKRYDDACAIFLTQKDYYACGLCSLLLQDTTLAKQYWQLCQKNSPAAQWGLCVLDLINLKEGLRPTFFQTRAFLEVYLNLFLENNLIEWAENLVSMNDVFFRANPESYKFIARALFANSIFDVAITFCKKSLRVFYADPEAFLILSQCYYLTGELNEAREDLDRILAMSPDYYPVKLFDEILKKEMHSR